MHPLLSLVHEQQLDADASQVVQVELPFSTLQHFADFACTPFTLLTSVRYKHYEASG